MKPASHRMRTFAAAFALSVAVGFTASAAMAQDAQSMSPTDVSPAELREFAATSLEVDAVIEKWRPLIAEADSAAREHQLNTAASRELRETVEDGGLTKKRYDYIYTMMHRNPEIASRIRDYKRELEQE